MTPIHHNYLVSIVPSFQRIKNAKIFVRISQTFLQNIAFFQKIYFAKKCKNYAKFLWEKNIYWNSSCNRLVSQKILWNSLLWNLSNIGFFCIQISHFFLWNIFFLTFLKIFALLFHENFAIFCEIVFTYHYTCYKNV